ncbi:MAG: 3-dehydroquinate dehydratase [Rhodobacterales bacterium 32-67-9]|nr:MAG: 3-dehydroquinate dehydratase [Rhodobacterales bacterium 32-67-9]
MRLGYITSTERGLTDRVLADAATQLARQGYSLAGVVQTNVARPQRFHCDMDLRLLPDGPEIGITQNLGANARGCRLDPGALEAAVANVSARLATGRADLLLLNKFGKHEAEGRGFRPVIAEALALGLPVILGVNGLNLAAFHAFTGGLAEELPADAGRIAGWCARSLFAAA